MQVIADNAQSAGAMGYVHKKLLTAAAIATLLVPLTSAPSEGAAITCTMGTFSACDTVSSGGTVGAGFVDGSRMRTAFDSDGDASPDYFLNLIFHDLLGSFDVTISDNLFDPQTLNNSGDFGAFLGGGSCVALAPRSSGPDACVVFEIDAPGPADDTWGNEEPPDGGYQVDFAWFLPTDDDFPDPIVVINHLPHGDEFDEDITIPGSYYTDDPVTEDNPCANCSPNFPLYVGPPGIIIESLGVKKAGDPGISGEDNSFSLMAIISPTATAPEPVTLTLIGLGIGGLLYRRRRH
jgi:hypothetical protein